MFIHSDVLSSWLRFWVKSAGVSGPTPAGLVWLDGHPFDRGTPVGEAQFPECPRLERVGHARCQVADGRWQFRGGEHDRCPMDIGSCDLNHKMAVTAALCFPPSPAGVSLFMVERFRGM